MTARETEWPTILLLAATYAFWALGTLLWPASGVVSVLVTGWAIAQFSSLQHEVLHGHPFRNPTLNEALVFPAFALCIPYRRFRDTHLAHHYDPNLTDPYDDPESNYLDPAVWARLSGPARLLLRLNNTLVGRVTMGPILGTALWLRGEWRLWRAGTPGVGQAWALNLAGLIPVFLWLWAAGMPVWGYLLAVWLGTGLLRIRTFLEHRAHDAFRARTVVIEDRGPLALLFLNNNLHVVHHMHPAVPWYRLPALYAARKEHYLRRNEGYLYRSYFEIVTRYLLRAKDPVPHPIWPVRKSERADMDACATQAMVETEDRQPG